MKEDLLTKYLVLLHTRHFTPKEKNFLIRKDKYLTNFFKYKGKDITIDKSVVKKDLDWLNEAKNNHIITFADSNYPEILREIEYPPLVLFAKGDISILSKPKIAIVGSRCASIAGKDTASKFAQELAEKNFIIVSGLAIGIDSAAHNGAIINGKTIAVLGSGLDIIYPLRNIGLAEKIVSTGGAIVSEFPIGTNVTRYNFPRRNRIISGLSLGVLVIEARDQSGSIITAKYALMQNREVFAVPSSIFNYKAKGCHDLIRQGAKLVEGIDHILEELIIGQSKFGIEESENLSYCKEKPTQKQSKLTKKGGNLTFSGKFCEKYATLFEHIGYNPVSIEELSCLTGLSINEVVAQLTHLELENIVIFCDGGYKLTEKK